MCRDARFENPHAHTRWGWGRGGIEEVRGDKSGPHSKIFTELLNKNAIKPGKGVPSLPKFLQPLCTLPPENLAKTSWTLPPDFQTVCMIVTVHPSVTDTLMHTG
jgi:hypothetical protein